MVVVFMQVDKDLRVMLVKPEAPAPRTIDVTVWRKAIPQFNLHHLDNVQVTPHPLRYPAPLCQYTSSYAFMPVKLVAKWRAAMHAFCINKI